MLCSAYLNNKQASMRKISNLVVNKDHTVVIKVRKQGRLPTYGTAQLQGNVRMCLKCV